MDNTEGPARSLSHSSSDDVDYEFDYGAASTPSFHRLPNDALVLAMTYLPYRTALSTLPRTARRFHRILTDENMFSLWGYKVQTLCGLATDRSLALLDAAYRLDKRHSKPSSLYFLLQEVLVRMLNERICLVHHWEFDCSFALIQTYLQNGGSVPTAPRLVSPAIVRYYDVSSPMSFWPGNILRGITINGPGAKASAAPMYLYLGCFGSKRMRKNPSYRWGDVQFEQEYDDYFGHRLAPCVKEYRGETTEEEGTSSSLSLSVLKQNTTWGNQSYLFGLSPCSSLASTSSSSDDDNDTSRDKDGVQWGSLSAHDRKKAQLVALANRLILSNLAEVPMKRLLRGVDVTSSREGAVTEPLPGLTMEAVFESVLDGAALRCLLEQEQNPM